MPLYCAGLWDAVNMAPGASSRPAAKYTRSVETRPRSIDVDTLGHHPFGERGHQLDARWPHVPTDQDPGAPAKVAKATPKARQMLGVELIGDGAADVVGLDDLIEESSCGQAP